MKCVIKIRIRIAFRSIYIRFIIAGVVHSTVPVQLFLGKDNQEFWIWKVKRNGIIFDTVFDHRVFPIQALQEASSY